MQILQTAFDSELGQKAAALRVEVFVQEQHVPPEEELDHYDASATHFVALENDRVIATFRIVRLDSPEGPIAKIGRVAVAKIHRNRGIGRQIMLVALAHARAAGYKKCTLGAQIQVVAFYEKLGFIPHGPIFDDAGIPHRQMSLDLTEPAA